MENGGCLWTRVCCFDENFNGTWVELVQGQENFDNRVIPATEVMFSGIDKIVEEWLSVSSEFGAQMNRYTRCVYRSNYARL